MGPHPDVAAALDADLLRSVSEDYTNHSGMSGPALLLSSMHQQHGAWCDIAMHGPLAQTANLVRAAAAALRRQAEETALLQRTIQLQRSAEAQAIYGGAGHGSGGRSQRPELARGAKAAAEGLTSAPAELAGRISSMSMLLDAHTLEGLLCLASLRVSTDALVSSTSEASVMGAPTAAICAAVTVAAAPASATAGNAQGLKPSPNPLRRLGLVTSLTAAELLPAVGSCLQLFPCDTSVRGAVDMAVTWLPAAQHTACWVVQWFLLLLQVALVDARERLEGEEQEGEGQEQQQERQEGAQGQPMPRVSGAWRRQLLDQVDVVGSLCGVVRLLATYPRVHLGLGPGDEGQPPLRALLPHGALAACLDAAAAAFPQEVHAAFCGPAPAAGQGLGQGVDGSGGGSSSNGRAAAALLNVRVLLGKGGPLELDGGAWVGSGGSCFWCMVEQGPEGAGQAVAGVVMTAGEQAGHLVGLLVPGEECMEEGW